MYNVAILDCISITMDTNNNRANFYPNKRKVKVFQCSLSAKLEHYNGLRNNRELKIMSNILEIQQIT